MNTWTDGRRDPNRSSAVRRLVNQDFDELVRIADVVQKTDSYPGRRPHDLRTFLVSDDALAGWVAECDGAIVGHVALHRTSLPVAI